jgi:predicted RNA polymerase sigma factor
MNFGLLLSQLPRVEESRTHYDDMLHLQQSEAPRTSFWRRIAAIFH